MPSTWSWQVILGFLSRSQRRRARCCASCGAPTTTSRPVPFARFASPSARVPLCHLSQGQDRCPSLQFHTGGRGVRLPPGLPFGAQLLRALRGLCDLIGARSDARTAPCPSTAPALTACCLRSRLAGCSSSPPRTTTILGSLGISGAMRTDLPAHILRADAVVGTESARRVDFACVDGRVPGVSWDPTGSACTCEWF